MGAGVHSAEHCSSSAHSLTISNSIFDQIKLQISYNNLKFGQNKSCRGLKDLQLSFWAEVDLELRSRTKTESKTAKTKIKSRTRLTLMTNFESTISELTRD